MARVGIFGGTFDPIHFGHLAPAVNARQAAGLDRILLVVANVPWQKEGTRELTPAQTRFELVRQAVEGIDGLEASDVEIKRGGLSYTIDTVSELRRLFPSDRFFLVVGADAAAGIEDWERTEELPALSELVVVNRPGHPRPEKLGGWSKAIMAEIPSLDISSTDLRQRARDDRPLEFLMPSGAIEYIRQNQLYRDEP